MPSPSDPRPNSIPPICPEPVPHLRNARVRHAQPGPLPPPRRPGPPEAGSNIRLPFLRRGRASRTAATTVPWHRPGRAVRRTTLGVLEDSLTAIGAPSARRPSPPISTVQLRSFRVESFLARTGGGAPCPELPEGSPTPAGIVPAWPVKFLPASAQSARIQPQLHPGIEAEVQNRFQSDPWPAPPSIPPGCPAAASSQSKALLDIRALLLCGGHRGGPSSRKCARTGSVEGLAQRSACGCDCVALALDSWHGKQPG